MSTSDSIVVVDRACTFFGCNLDVTEGAFYFLHVLYQSLNVASISFYKRTGGPSIDAGAPLAEDSRILRYTPPVPEFEVLILQCDPGDSIQLTIKNVPAVFVIIEGTGALDGGTICQPGRCYYHPAAAKPISFAVPAEKRGPLKVAVAHRNLHLQVPTTFSRHGSLAGSAALSPYQGTPPQTINLVTMNLNADLVIPDC